MSDKTYRLISIDAEIRRLEVEIKNHQIHNQEDAIAEKRLQIENLRQERRELSRDAARRIKRRLEKK